LPAALGAPTLRAVDIDRRAPDLAAAGGAEFDAVVRRLRAGELRADPAPRTRTEPLRPGDVEPWPAPGTARHAAFARLGEAALRQGAVASAVVAGGAGTRFGAEVKGLVPVVGGRTFLDLKLEDARSAGAAAGAAVPVVIMTSEATQEGIAARVEGEPDVLVFRQRSLPRLTPELELFLDERGAPSLAPAGHGDFFRALRESGVGAALRARGVRVFLFSNVDNLAATLDPVAIGAHLALGRSMMVEVTARRSASGALDVGAAPVRMGERVALVEQVDPAAHPLISTNNLWFDLGAVLARELPLPWRIARKTVTGRPALQLEQVTGEVTALVDPSGAPLLPSAWLEVPREPAGVSRFEPVKAREDLTRVATRLRERLTH